MISYAEVGENEVRFVRFAVTDGDGGSGSDVKKIELTRSDNDDDGVDNDEENSAPFGGDGNQDGIPDREQAELRELIQGAKGANLRSVYDDYLEASDE